MLCLVSFTSCTIIKVYTNVPTETAYPYSTTIIPSKSTDTVKIYRNGQILILDSIGTYTITGQKRN